VSEQVPWRFVARRLLPCIALLSFAGTACLDAGAPIAQEPAPTDTTKYQALLDDAAWLPSTLQVAANTTGGFRLSGQSVFTLSPVYISLSVSHVNGPGTYALGVNERRITGGTGSLVSGLASWSTGYSGDAGIATITKVTATRIAGTFAFSAPPTGTFGGTRMVTQGVFDFPIGTSGIVISETNGGGTFSGSINGTAFNAADATQSTGSFDNTLRLSVSNSNYLIDVVLSEFTGPGTYTLGTSTQRTLTVRRNSSPFLQWGGSGANVGTVTISTVTSTSSDATSKSTGTLSATLQPSGTTPGTGPLMVNATWTLR
jgi:hypothetical protein